MAEQPVTPQLQYYCIDLGWEGAYGVFDYNQEDAVEQFVELFKQAGIKGVDIRHLLKRINVFEIKKGTVVKTDGEL